MSETDLLEISGVGQRKLEVYGDEFIAEIVKFMGEKNKGNHEKRYQFGYL